jgi:CRISPR-associated protein Cas6
VYWQDDQDEGRDRVAPDEVVDLAFALTGRTLPVDHAHPLYAALTEALPWLADERDAGVHTIHVAASQNGWYRPEGGAGGVLHVSRRTRLTLRLRGNRIEDARGLTGRTLEVGGHPLTVGDATVRALAPLATLFARQVTSAVGESEEAFLDSVAKDLRLLGVRPRKLLCGKTSEVRTPQGALLTRSLMVADLDRAESLALQRQGLRGERKLGCGLFVPHKGIAPVRKTEDG